MKFSYTWLKELSGTARSAQEVAAEITAKSFEVEDVVALGEGFDNVVVGEVLSKEKHPDADRLNVATVNVGAGESLMIVCGAPNLEAGQKVPVALVGAKLPTKDGTVFEIKKATMRGVESNGMICAEDELGLGDDHEGIMVLAPDAAVGMPFAQHMGLDDTVLDIDILPNRAHDCLSHIGVAREIAAIEERALEESTPTPVIPAEAGIQSGEALTIHVDTDLCPCYTATTIDGVDNTVTLPAYMTARLTACGLRSVSPIVDITNYVMLETGQPLHAFDADVIASDSEVVQIGVRTAQEGEKMTLLDDMEIELNKDDVVITNAQNAPIALGGVMGGRDSGVSATTTRVVIEVASFDAAAIRKTRSRHGIESDAAYRFERELSPALVARAQARVVSLIIEYCGGTRVAAAEYNPTPVVERTVDVSATKVNALLGTDLPVEEMVELLARVGVVAAANGDTLTCTIPSVRLDLVTTADITEEVGRLYGYEKIAPQPLTAAVTPPEENRLRTFEHAMRDALVAQGFVEVKGYSFYSVADAVACGLDPATHITLANPMSTEQEIMRRSLLPAMLRATSKSTVHADAVRIFEIGRTYIARDGELPVEHPVLALAIAAKGTQAEQFFALKGAVDSVLAGFGVRGYHYDDNIQKEGFDTDAGALHAGRRAMVRFGTQDAFGLLGEVQQKTARHFGIKNPPAGQMGTRVAVAEIALDVILAHATKKHTIFTPLPKFPTVERDLSMIVGPRTRVADVERVLSASGGELLQRVDLFDLYVNPETDERSMAFRCTFGADRTLTSDEVDTAIAAMITAVEEDGDITVRQ